MRKLTKREKDILEMLSIQAIEQANLAKQQPQISGRYMHCRRVLLSIINEILED